MPTRSTTIGASRRQRHGRCKHFQSVLQGSSSLRTRRKAPRPSAAARQLGLDQLACVITCLIRNQWRCECKLGGLPSSLFPELASRGEQDIGATTAPCLCAELKVDPRLVCARSYVIRSNWRCGMRRGGFNSKGYYLASCQDLKSLINPTSKQAIRPQSATFVRNRKHRPHRK